MILVGGKLQYWSPASDGKFMAAGLTVVSSDQPVGPCGVTTVPARDRTAPTIRHSTKTVDGSQTVGLCADVSARPSALRISVNGVGTFIVGFVCSLAFLAVVPAMWGFDPVVVASGSMSPALKTGDVVVTQTHPGLLAPGAVIRFDTAERSVIHRIAAVDGDRYVTKGDANEEVDSQAVRRRDVVGLGVMLVPFIGRPLIWLEHGDWVRLGAAMAVVVAALWVSPRQWLNAGAR